MRAALTFSFVFLLALCFGGTYRTLEATIKESKTPQRQLELVRDLSGDRSLARVAEKALLDLDKRHQAEVLRSVTNTVHLRALIELGQASPNVQSLAARIKASPFYKDPGVRDESNWLMTALKRLKNIQFPKFDPPDQLPQTAIGEWLIWVLWGLLFIGVLAFLIFGIRYGIKLKRKSKVSSLIEDEESDKSLDEWLATADRFEAEGKFREAIRSLYLACLLKIDEARIARFDRGQTNWEHLYRIESSPRRPETLDFRNPTKEFDLVWYGNKNATRAGLAQFRNWYCEIKEITERVSA